MGGGNSGSDFAGGGIRRKSGQEIWENDAASSIFSSFLRSPCGDLVSIKERVPDLQLYGCVVMTTVKFFSAQGVGRFLLY